MNEILLGEKQTFYYCFVNCPMGGTSLDGWINVADLDITVGGPTKGRR